MKRSIPYLAMIVLAALAAGCNRAGTTTTPSNTSATTPSTTMTTPSGTTTTVATTSDTSTPAAATTATGSSNSTPGISDTVTMGRVKAAIIADPALKNSDIVVKTENNGVVILSGTAKSQDQIALATELAKRQEGVNRVETMIVVR